MEHVRFVCVWCGVDSNSKERFNPCCAPDGDGHLFERKVISENKENKDETSVPQGRNFRRNVVR